MSPLYVVSGRQDVPGYSEQSVEVEQNGAQKSPVVVITQSLTSPGALQSAVVVQALVQYD